MNVRANAQGSIHIHYMFLSTYAYSISYFTTGPPIHTNLIPPLFTKEKQNWRTPQCSQPATAQLCLYFSCHRRDIRQPAHMSSRGKQSSPLACSAGCRSWSDHFSWKPPDAEWGDRPESERLEEGEEVSQQSWVAWEHQGSPLRVALLCIQDYWLSSPNPTIKCPGQKKKIYTDTLYTDS